MDLLDYETDDSTDAQDMSVAAAAHGKKRARDGATASLVPSAQPKLQRSQQSSTDVSSGSALPAPAAPAFRSLDSDTQSASAAARRAANALFERRAAARGDTLEESGPAASGGGPGEGAATAAAAAAAASTAAWKPVVIPAAVPLDPARALDTRTLGLLDARARRELGLGAQGQWEGAERQQQQALPAVTSSCSSGSALPWGLPAAPVGGIMEVSGRQVRNSGWEAAHLEAMAAAAHSSAGDGAARRAGPIAATVWNHATGKAEVTTGGGSRASKSKHQIHTLAAAAAGHVQRTADKAAEASIQAVLARQAGGGWR
jgi:hypothetical protein